MVDGMQEENETLPFYQLARIFFLSFYPSFVFIAFLLKLDALSTQPYSLSSSVIVVICENGKREKRVMHKGESVKMLMCHKKSVHG